MTTIANHFMSEHFNNLPLRPSLFYSWKNGIRFEVSMPWGGYNNKNNLNQIKERSIGIFNHVIQDADELLLITDINCQSNDTFLQKRPANVYPKYINDKNLLRKLQHHVLPNVFSEGNIDGDYENMVTHRFVLPCKKSDIRYRQLLTAISYEDFAHPSTILKQNYSAGYDIYFINMTKKVIYHLYDDRGSDVIASNKEDLRQLYYVYNDWILNYDRDQIDLLFK